MESKEHQFSDDIRTRYSMGIALCMRCEDGIVRVLLVNRRYTYAFYAFVCGHYNEHSDVAIIGLFDKMTVDEKVSIMSMNFAQIWYSIWLNQCQPGSYIMARNKFNESIVGDGGIRLRSLMRRSRTNADRVWEIPKGHKKHQTECDMDCAIRELYEETGIPRSAYRITNGTYNITFEEEGVRYRVTYFIAIALRRIIQRINASAIDQISEICNMCWVSASDMATYAPRDVPGHRRIVRFARKVIANKFGRMDYSLRT
jgi:8-oxo-dGTP pyrophosphatase MutT (NUDIX family)